MNPRNLPFGGVPVYNPQSLNKTEAIAQFHARKALYQRLLDALRDERPQHVLLIGARGMGKTTLLQRLRYGVEDDASLSARYLPLAFPEEQYNVAHLHGFLLNAVDALADAFEHLNQPVLLAEAEKRVEEMAALPPERVQEIEELAPQYLAEIAAKTGKSLLLLVDNADRLFETLEDKEQWRLRELLQDRADLTFYGATTQASEGLYGHDRAFYEFFSIRTLGPLNAAEVRDLMLQLADSIGASEPEATRGAARRRVETWLSEDPGRLRTLVQLTGGNPRTTVLLFHLVLDGLEGGAREYLERLLDQVTPGYKGRVDDLPTQAQQVLDATALAWDPVTAAEVSARTGLETSAVSSQLTRLMRQGILEKTDQAGGKKALYQVAERFFNIWYLMRASRRVRARLRWFVEFLKAFFEPTELEALALETVEKNRTEWQKRPEAMDSAACYLQAAGAAARRRALTNLRNSDPAAAELLMKHMGEYAQANGHGEDPRTEEELKEALDSDPKSTDTWVALARLLVDQPGRREEAEAAARKAIDVEPDFAPAWNVLGRAASKIPERFEEAEAAYRKAAELDPAYDAPWVNLGNLLSDIPERHAEAEAAYRKAADLDPANTLPWVNLGNLLYSIAGRHAEAEAAFRKAAELDPADALPWNNLGSLLCGIPNRHAEAETAYRKAAELAPADAVPWFNLGTLLTSAPNRKAEAEMAYRKAVELDPMYAFPWYNLGKLLSGIPGRRAEAEAAYRKAIELAPADIAPWNNLGSLLSAIPERRTEAENAYRRAAELDPASALPWYNLGNLLCVLPDRRAEAEAAYRKAAELDCADPAAWNNLGNLLSGIPERRTEAEAAYRKAAEVQPAAALPWYNLGNLLAGIADRREDAETAYYKAAELDPTFAAPWFNLGHLLARTIERRSAAEAAFREAARLDPTNSGAWNNLGGLLEDIPERRGDAEAAYRRAIVLDPANAHRRYNLSLLLFKDAGRFAEAEEAGRKAMELDPADAEYPAHLGDLLSSQPDRSEEAAEAFTQALSLNPESEHAWDGLFSLCEFDASLWPRLLAACDSVLARDAGNWRALLFRAVALAEAGDFPRASVALDDALSGDPIAALSRGRRALERFFAAAIRCERAEECLQLILKKDWKDAWRPIYEALEAARKGTAEYLKRVAVEIRGPAIEFLRAIAPDLPGLPRPKPEE